MSESTFHGVPYSEYASETTILGKLHSLGAEGKTIVEALKSLGGKEDGANIAEAMTNISLGGSSRPPFKIVVVAKNEESYTQAVISTFLCNVHQAGPVFAASGLYKVLDEQGVGAMFDYQPAPIQSIEGIEEALNGSVTLEQDATGEFPPCVVAFADDDQGGQLDTPIMRPVIFELNETYSTPGVSLKLDGAIERIITGDGAMTFGNGGFPLYSITVPPVSESDYARVVLTAEVDFTKEIEMTESGHTPPLNPQEPIDSGAQEGEAP